MNSPRTATAVVTALFLIFTGMLVGLSWLADDAFITFRVCENFINGDGLRWNIDERVQVYTNPLWLFLNACFFWVTNEIYLTAHFVAITTSLVTVLIVLQVDRILPQAKALILILFLLSRSFMHYSSSGLENPLSHLLAALFAIEYLSGPKPRLSRLVLLLSLAMVNRLDLVVLLLPGLCWAISTQFQMKNLARAALSAWPIMLWLLFATIYYGSPLPNTFFAKLAHGLTRDEMLRLGAHYLMNSLRTDTITLTTVLITPLLLTAVGRVQLATLALGGSLYVAYIVSAGGDYMSGRFFSTPYLLVVVTLGYALGPWLTNQRLLTCAATLLVAIGVLRFFNWSDPEAIYGGRVQPKFLTSCIDDNGIGDEWACGYEDTSLWAYDPDGLNPFVDDTLRGLAIDKSPTAVANIGALGFAAARKFHLVDHLALGDPLLARLPVARKSGFRQGHFYRDIPAGYLESLRTGNNVIENEKIRSLYERIRILSRGPLFTRKRWQIIVEELLRPTIIKP